MCKVARQRGLVSVARRIASQASSTETRTVEITHGQGLATAAAGPSLRRTAQLFCEDNPADIDAEARSTNTDAESERGKGPKSSVLELQRSTARKPRAHPHCLRVLRPNAGPAPASGAAALRPRARAAAARRRASRGHLYALVVPKDAAARKAERIDARQDAPHALRRRQARVRARTFGHLGDDDPRVHRRHRDARGAQVCGEALGRHVRRALAHAVRVLHARSARQCAAERRRRGNSDAASGLDDGRAGVLMRRTRAPDVLLPMEPSFEPISTTLEPARRRSRSAHTVRSGPSALTS